MDESKRALYGNVQPWDGVVIAVAATRYVRVKLTISARSFFLSTAVCLMPDARHHTPARDDTIEHRHDA